MCKWGVGVKAEEMKRQSKERTFLHNLPTYLEPWIEKFSKVTSGWIEMCQTICVGFWCRR